MDSSVQAGNGGVLSNLKYPFPFVPFPWVKRSPTRLFILPTPVARSGGFCSILSRPLPSVVSFETMVVGVLALQGSFNEHIAGIVSLLVWCLFNSLNLYNCVILRVRTPVALIDFVFTRVFGVAALRRVGVKGVEVRKPEQLQSVNALIIPGGESTSMAKLAGYHNLVRLCLLCFRIAYETFTTEEMWNLGFACCLIVLQGLADVFVLIESFLYIGNGIFSSSTAWEEFIPKALAKLEHQESYLESC